MIGIELPHWAGERPRMTEPESYEFLSQMLRKVFERNDITATPELTAKDVFGWDSFKQVELLMEIQEALDIEFTTDEMDNIPNIGALAGMVRAHVAAGG
jgi:acyl carrier protein